MTYLKFEEVFETYHYPAGEIHVTMRPDFVIPEEHVVIETHCRTADDIFALAMAARVPESVVLNCTFFVPSMPFARHDHRRDRRDGYPIDLLAMVLAGLPIITADPHSDVVGNMFVYIPQSGVFEVLRDSAPWKDDNPVFVIPDAGAAKKAHTWLRPDDDFIQCLKTRDRSTGRLSGFTYNPADLPADTTRPFVIVDDICDGGGTFIGIARALREHVTGPMHLAVSHGLFPSLAKLHTLMLNFDSAITFRTPTSPRHPKLTLVDWKYVARSANFII